MTVAFKDPQFTTDNDLHKVEIKTVGNRYVIIIDDRHIFLTEAF